MPYASVIRFRRAAMLVAAVTPWASAATLAADVAAPSRSHLVPVSEAARTPSPATGLGMTLSRASPVLRRQLALTRGAGLVVDSVTPGSPAARAGFEPHDVVVRLDDQILVLPEQLDALLEWAEPEDPLECTVLRGGRSVSISLAGKIVRQTPQARGLRPTASSLALVKPPKPQPVPADSTLRRLNEETLLREDGDFRIQLTRGDETRLTVTDLTGQVVFNGAIDTPAVQARIPMAIRGRVVAMMQSLEQRPATNGQLVGTAPVAPPAASQSRGPERIGQLDLPAIELR
jgi:hypothetical protein